MRAREFTIHVNGHPGHHGNVLAFAFLERLHALLAALAHAERNYLGVANRQTDYEIVHVAKVNPTELTLSPVTNHRNYDPCVALAWTFKQIENISNGEAVDDKVDEGLARAFTKIVPRSHHTGAVALWISLDSKTLKFDDDFKVRSEAVASMRKATAKKSAWASVKSGGSVVGELLQVDDLEGKAQFAIRPPIGPDKITCIFPEDQREQMKQHLFQMVRVHGTLHYEASSPFPIKVEMHRIEAIEPVQPENHLLHLRGLFKGRPRITDETGEAFGGI